MKIRKTPSETELLSLLLEEVRFPPFTLTVEDNNVRTDRGVIGACVRFGWGDREYRFVVECKRLWTPKAISEQIARVRRYARPPAYYPMIVVPYLPDERLAELEAEGVSGLDLCGNGIVVVPNEILVVRTGRPNQYRPEAEIKNVFRGNSSLVSRVFLLVPEFASLQEVGREVERRGGRVTLGTVSKVCKTLEGLLVIDSARCEGTAARRLKLLQPEKLLDLLAENYTAPQVARTVRGKMKPPGDALRALLNAGVEGAAKVVQTGFGSVGAYAVMAKEPVQDFYCSDLDGILRALGGAFEETERFANVTFTETKDNTVYFDRRPGFVASPVQTYLELVTGDKRSQETAEQLRRTILRPLERRAG